MNSFYYVVNVRISKDILHMAERVIRKNKDKYRNLSHYVRVALIKLNREEGKVT